MWRLSVQSTIMVRIEISFPIASFFFFLFMIAAASLRVQAYFQFIAMYCNSMPQNRKRFYMIYRSDRNHIPWRVSPEASFKHFNILDIYEFLLYIVNNDDEKTKKF